MILRPRASLLKDRKHGQPRFKLAPMRFNETLVSNIDHSIYTPENEELNKFYQFLDMIHTPLPLLALCNLTEEMKVRVDLETSPERVKTLLKSLLDRNMVDLKSKNTYVLKREYRKIKLKYRVKFKDLSLAMFF